MIVQKLDEQIKELNELKNSFKNLKNQLDPNLEDQNTFSMAKTLNSNKEIKLKISSFDDSNQTKENLL